MSAGNIRRTVVGDVDGELLAFTVGNDLQTDSVLVEADCIGTAAHVVMLSRLAIQPHIFTQSEVHRVIQELLAIMRDGRAGRFRIRLRDQDVHMAVERRLTRKLGDLGRRVHTGRSRNDQVAVDLRLYSKEQMGRCLEDVCGLVGSLLDSARRYRRTPMVGRTHMQPAMPSTLGLWFAAFAEELLDDLAGLRAAYELNDQCPLGAAAGYGVPMGLDRKLVSDLLGFSRPVGTVLHAINARGKLEGTILDAMGRVMLALSRMASDLILFSIPEFGYLRLPDEFCTGSSIMPQKRNPDVLELIRARTANVLAGALQVKETVRGLPSGYQRDLQETKEPLMRGVEITRGSLRAMSRIIAGLEVDADALRGAFRPEVFAADEALRLTAGGMPFREAYRRVRSDLEKVAARDALAAVAQRSSSGAPGNLRLADLRGRLNRVEGWVKSERAAFHKALGRLLGVEYPEL